MALFQYSLSNFSNSLGEYLSETALGANYLVYWVPTDVLQTPDGFYPQYFGNQSSILETPSVSARFSASRGILSILNQDSSIPESLARPTSDGALAAPDDVPVPAIWLSVEHLSNGALVQLGSKVRYRYVEVVLLSYARTFDEQLYLANVLRSAFDESEFLTIRDHDAGTRAAIDKVEIQSPEISTALFPLQADAKVYEVALTARLCYEA
jgi:hypothetical protein